VKNPVYMKLLKGSFQGGPVPHIAPDSVEFSSKRLKTSKSNLRGRMTAEQDNLFSLF
jgi:hypothetical protein